MTTYQVDYADYLNPEQVEAYCDLFNPDAPSTTVTDYEQRYVRKTYRIPSFVGLEAHCLQAIRQLEAFAEGWKRGGKQGAIDAFRAVTTAGN